MFERREIAPFTARALTAFDGVKGDPRNWAYVLDFRDLRFGMVRTRLAPWWQESMSSGMADFRQEV